MMIVYALMRVFCIFDRIHWVNVAYRVWCTNSTFLTSNWMVWHVHLSRHSLVQGRNITVYRLWSIFKCIYFYCTKLLYRVSCVGPGSCRMGLVVADSLSVCWMSLCLPLVYYAKWLSLSIVCHQVVFSHQSLTSHLESSHYNVQETNTSHISLTMLMALRDL